MSDLTSFISNLRTDPNIAAWRTIPARAAQFAEFPRELHPALVVALRTQGITALYTHQASAFDHARKGEHVVIVTGTASGKTLGYNLPVLDRLLNDSTARALYLFPTKALAQDQVANLKSFRGAKDALPLPIATYDGDTPANDRPAIRKNARLVVSNPDMLHTGILPHHTLWADFFHNLQFVVIDEMHAYRGVFGSHVANVLRRLERIAKFYGAAPQYILTSATIANPVELAERLIEQHVTLVDNDGAAKGEKHFVIYNPPLVNRALGVRKSALLEAARLTEELLGVHVQTIVFARARRSVEVMLRYLTPTPAAGEQERGEGRAVRGYRSGYLPAQRREIERGLREGSVRAVVATNALELGIDIGGMDAAVLTGYPGSIAATWQQAGRAGRTDEAALAVLVATADPLDQFVAHHPDYFFGRSPERALINPDNLLILLDHLRCAAFEQPFRAGDKFGRTDVSEFLDFLSESGVLHRSGEKYFWMADRYPADSLSLRSASAEAIVLQSEGQVIGQVDRASAYALVHPQAIYLHEAASYIVDDLDMTAHVAHLRPTDAEYYTEPRSETTVQLLDKLAEADAGGAAKAHGEIAVTTQIVGYRKIKWFTHENLGTGTLALPPSELHTTGYWLALKDETVEALRAEGLWSNDPNDYGPEWPMVRDRIRARDGYRCTSCGTPEEGRAHHVHHKIPFRAFPS
ncbi:MAG TPA: DEAD/DEAH box helicase, partial [Anaerolineae bacterium]